LALALPTSISQVIAGGNGTPGELRFVSPTGATSDCIGDPRTPLCALETFLACTARLDAALCHRVGVEDYTFRKKLTTLNYYVVSTHTIREEDITEDLKDAYWRKVGYVDITILEPSFRMPWCPEGCKISYTLGPTDDGWRLIDYAVSGAP